MSEIGAVQGKAGGAFVLAALLVTAAIADEVPSAWQAPPELGSGEAALEHARHLDDAAAAEEPWEATVGYLAAALEDAGFGKLDRQDLAAGAASAYPVPIRGRWRPLRAEVRLEKVGRTLLTLEEAPGFVAQGSDTVTAEADVVYIKGGAAATDYLGEEVAGRLVLASGPLPEVYRRAVVERGAVGVLSYFDDELDRGILEPAQIPQRGLLGPGDTGAPKPGSFALTLPQVTARELQRSALQKRPLKVRVEIEMESLEPTVEALWTELEPAQEAAETVLLFSVSEEGSPRPGGFAALLETARVYGQLRSDGSLVPQRRIVFLWASHPAAVRAWLAGRGEGPVAAWELGEVGRAPGLVFVEPPRSRVTWWSDWQAWTLERIRQARLGAPSQAVMPFAYAVRPYRRAGDSTLLGGSGSFPSLRLEGSVDGDFDAVEMLRAVTALVVGAAPAITAAEPDGLLLRRACERWRARYADWVAIAAAGGDDPGSGAQAARAAWSVLRAARAETEARFAGWSGVEARAEALESCSAGLERAAEEAEVRLAAYLQALYRSLDQEPAAVTASDAETAAAGLGCSRPEAATEMEVAGVELVAGGERTALAIDPEAAFQALDRCSDGVSLLELFQQLQGELGFSDVEGLMGLLRELQARSLLGTTVKEAAEVTVALQVPWPPDEDTPPPPSPYERGRALERQGRNEEALAQYRKVGRDSPDHPKAQERIEEIIGIPPPPEPSRYERGRAHESAGRVQQALREYRKVDPDSPDHADAQARIEKLEHLETSKAAYERGIALESERRCPEAIAAYKAVARKSPLYGKARARITGLGDCGRTPNGGYLGILRATLAKGDGRTVRGSLAQGESRAYSLDVEAPGYGDLEVAVPIGFRVVGSGLELRGIKDFVDDGQILARYARVNIPTGTRVEFELHNKKSDEPEYECEIYLYPK